MDAGLGKTFSVSRLTGNHDVDARLIKRHLLEKAGEQHGWTSVKDVEAWLKKHNLNMHHAGGNKVQLIGNAHKLPHSGGAALLRLLGGGS